jgi:tetraacyldisaccharide 4'-kinase
MAAWAAGELRRRGAAPAIVLRGYGDDEPDVHARLNPDLPVIVAPDRVRGVREARERGADVAVLDDAFQHRRIGRIADWVLISADRWMDRRRLLPAGPWREPLNAVARATAVIVTRKAASAAEAAELAGKVRTAAGAIPLATAHLALDDLRDAAGGGRRPLASLRGAKVFLVSGIGDPAALRRQLEAEGAFVRSRTYPDHHAFGDAELGELARAAGDDVVVCTLKDAVKVGPRWPRGAPTIWYVSQRVVIEDGADGLARSLDLVLGARTTAFTAAGASRPSF